MSPCILVMNDQSIRHDLKGHPESELRMEQIRSSLNGSRRSLQAPPASMDDLHRVHLPEYLFRLEDLSGRCRPGGIAFLDSDTYVVSGSWDAARYAAGAAIAAAGEALSGLPAFSVARPPGHHAGPVYGMGFCLMNNVAVAAAWALRKVSQVAIIDWDVHHGNGTQAIFYDSDRVLYCSVHRSPFFPGTGSREETGSGEGEGFTMNVPLPSGSGGDAYLRAFQEEILPAVCSFDPDLILISAGQDSLSDDPLGGMNLGPGDFSRFTELVCSVARKPPALVLEGGYGPSHGEAITEILRVLDRWE
ncbi:MAG TPA: histone deacetylase [Methanoregulaceae archaeon]|nr:histone deacetylase [Methanoregulaceae archaeon]